MTDKELRSIGLSKSRIANGNQCLKRLYLEVHFPETVPAVDAVTQGRFDAGSEIGRRARTLFPDGLLIEAGYDEGAKALENTRTLIEGGALTLFEPAFAYKNVFVRVDILSRPVPDAPWHLIEVKSSTSVKKQHLDDIATQAWVVRGSNQKVDRYSIMFINNQCAFPFLENLFSTENVSKEVEIRLPNIPKTVTQLLDVLRGSTLPTIKIGPHCDTPYECPFKKICWEGVNSPSIFEIPGIGEKKVWELYGQGIVSLRDLRLQGLKGMQAKAVEAVRSGEIWLNREIIREELRKWKWPLHFLDFETVNSAIPRYMGVLAYQQVPFQFSCHIQRELGMEPRHIEYLHRDTTDPRPAVAAALTAAIGTTGNIVAYNRSAEGGAITRLADACPQYRDTLLDLKHRLVDPLPLIRKAVYAPGFKGSFSIKYVAPALLGECHGYGGLEVAGGQEAQIAFEKMISLETLSQERCRLEAAMLACCKQDTYVIAKLVEWLFRKISD